MLIMLAMATYLHGYVQKRLHKNLNQSLVAFEHAIALDPNLAVAHNYVGQIKVFLGRANEAAEHTFKAIQLSPHDPQLAEWYYQLAVTSFTSSAMTRPSSGQGARSRSI